MRSTNTFSILFWADQNNTTDDQALLYARITVDGKRVNISLKRKLAIILWDAKKKRAKGNSAEAKQINLYLDQTHSQLFQCYQDLKFKGELITAQLIKASYGGELETSKTLNQLIDYHTGKIKGTLAPGTVVNFGITENYIKRYLSSEYKTPDMFLKQLDYKFICDFETYLHNYWPKGHPRMLNHNTIMKHIQRLRKMVTLAFHMEWLERDPFVRWKPTWEKKEREFLSENELSNLESFHFSIERLERVRDLFVFSCYTGISYVDIMNLTPENVHKGIDGDYWIITSRQKTKTPVKVPLLSMAEELIEKYAGHATTQITGSLMPIITNEKLNQYLKEVAFYCGIRKNLTFHMARHSFATTITLSNGVPIETVSKSLGHTKIATTQIYARVIESKVSNDMNNLKALLSKKETEPKKNHAS